MKRTIDNVLNTFKKRRTGITSSQDIQQEDEEIPEFQRRDSRMSFLNLNLQNILPKKQRKAPQGPVTATEKDKRKMTKIQNQRKMEDNSSFFSPSKESTTENIFSQTPFQFGGTSLFSPNKDVQKSTQKIDFFSPTKTENFFTKPKQEVTPLKEQNIFSPSKDNISFSGFKDIESFSGFNTPIQETPNSYERQLFLSPEKENRCVTEPFIFGQNKKVTELKNEGKRSSRNSPKRPSPREKISYKRKIEEVEVYNPMDKPCTLKISLIKARNLIATERGFKEKSDPFFVLETENQKSVSKIVNSTTDPEFGQTFTFICNPNTLRLKLTVFDHDHVFDHLYLGKVELFLNDVFYQCKSRNTNSEEVSGWYKISEGQGEVFLVYRMFEGLEMKF